jgi:hypothetical protein
MGTVEGIDFEAFPAQSGNLGAAVTVTFRYDATRGLGGRIVRDDRDPPFVTIIALDDGRHVLAGECQYAIGAARYV